MDSDEPAGIQLPFQRTERHPSPMGPTPPMKDDVIPIGLEVIDGVHFHKMDSVFLSNQKTGGPGTRESAPPRFRNLLQKTGQSRVQPTVLALPQTSPNPVQHDTEPVVVPRLYQVIESKNLEGLHGILVEGRYEDYLRHTPGPYLMDDSEPVQPRHLDVQENQVQVQPADFLYGFSAVLGFTHHQEIHFIRQGYPKGGPGKRFVVHDED